MRRRIILIGGGGHCKACIDVIEATGGFTVAGIVDLSEHLGEQILGCEIMGTDDDLPSLINDEQWFLVTLGHIKSPARRRELFEMIARRGAKLPSIVSPHAHASVHSCIGAGTIVMHHALINAGVKIGANAIVNTGAVIEHDAIVGDHSHISTRAVINGMCRIGSGTFIGSNSVLIQGVTVGPNIMVGAGSVVIRDLSEPGTYVGNPARRIS